jgi:hypothetical protein
VVDPRRRILDDLDDQRRLVLVEELAMDLGIQLG